MEKIVLTWSIWDGYEAGYSTYVDCLEYESVETLYVNLEQLVINYIAAEEK